MQDDRVRRGCAGLRIRDIGSSINMALAMTQIMTSTCTRSCKRTKSHTAKRGSALENSVSSPGRRRYYGCEEMLHARSVQPESDERRGIINRSGAMFSMPNCLADGQFDAAPHGVNSCAHK